MLAGYLCTLAHLRKGRRAALLRIQGPRSRSCRVRTLIRLSIFDMAFYAASSVLIAPVVAGTPPCEMEIFPITSSQGAPAAFASA